MTRSTLCLTIKQSIDTDVKPLADIKRVRRVSHHPPPAPKLGPSDDSRRILFTPARPSHPLRVVVVDLARWLDEALESLPSLPQPPPDCLTVYASLPPWLNVMLITVLFAEADCRSFLTLNRSGRTA